MLGARCRGTDGDRRLLLASAVLGTKAGRRVVNLELSGVLSRPGSWIYPAIRSRARLFAVANAEQHLQTKIEMNFRLSDDR
jgi:hypothetical protein